MNDVAVHPEDLASLVARAEARTRFPELALADTLAEELATKLALVPARFDERHLRRIALGEAVLDAVVKDFVRRHPAGLVISINPGICTRFSRIDNGKIHTIDLDRPEICAFKRSFFLPSDRHVRAAACGVACTGFLRHASDLAHLPVLIVTGRALLRADEARVDRFVTELVTRAPEGTEWIATYDANAPMRPARGMTGCLERVSPGGTSSFFPRARFVCQNASPAEVERALAGHNGVSKLFRGRFVPSFAHLVLV